MREQQREMAALKERKIALSESQCGLRLPPATRKRKEEEGGAHIL